MENMELNVNKSGKSSEKVDRLKKIVGILLQLFNKIHLQGNHNEL